MKLRVLDQLKTHEGFRRKPYACTAGKITIGYGRNLDDVGISSEEAEYLLRNDIDWAIQDARKLFPNFEELNEARQSVLVNMAFNLGRDTLARFSNLRLAVRNYNFDLAAEEMLDSRWARQVKRRAIELAETMKKGE